MNGLPNNLREQLLQLLGRLSEFNSDSSVRAIFVTQELWHLRTSLPQGESIAQRASKVVDFLLRERCLSIFLLTLAGHYHPATWDNGELQRLADQVAIYE